MRKTNCKKLISKFNFMSDSRSAQAALEFIMTYGWAILVVLVAIGALAYFGVLSPDRFLPSKCTMQPGIACLDHKATTEGTNNLQVVVQNSLGYDITITELMADKCTAKTALSTVVPNGGQYPATLCCGASCVPASAGHSGTKYNGEFNITYVTPSDVGGLTHKNNGQITTKVQ